VSPSEATIDGVDLERMIGYRKQNVVDAMARNDLDGILALKFENIRYITGLRPLWFPYVQLANAALINRDGDVICFVNGGDFEHRRQTMTWIPEGRMRGMPRLEDPVLAAKSVPMIADAVRELGFDSGRIGIDMEYPYVREQLARHLPQSAWGDADPPMRSARLIKNEDELAIFRSSCEAVDVGLAAAIEAVEPGRRENEVLGAAANAMYSRGMEIPQCSSIVTSGENLYPFQRYASEREIQTGDLVFIDIGGCFNGMFAEATRTVVCDGASNAQQRSIYAAVAAALEAALEAMKPGEASGVAHRAIAAAFVERGYGDHELETLVGHGIGVAGIETPMLGPLSLTGEEIELEPGMVFSVEPTLIVPGVPGGGGIRIEDEVVITESGAEAWTRAPLDDNLLGA